MLESKRPIAGIVNGTLVTSGNLYDDAVAQHYAIVADKAADPLVPILGPFPYGKTKSVSSLASQAEVTQQVLLGDAEVIVASQRYRVEVGNSEVLYETAYDGMKVFSTTAPAVLSGVAATDRLNIYTILANKINERAGLDVTASVGAGGLTIEDKPGYFSSRKGRKGVSTVQATQGFSASQFVVVRAGVYSRGIGADLARLAVVYDDSMQDAIRGDMNLELIHGGQFDAAATYRRYAIDVEDGDVDTLAFSSIATKTTYVLWVDEAVALNVTDFNTAFLAAAAK